MYLKAPTFSARFDIPICDMRAQAEDDFDTLGQVLSKLAQLQAVSPATVLSAVMIHFSLEKQGGSSWHSVDETSSELLEDVCKELGVKAQHFFNHRMASYDNLNNTLTPLDFGLSLPDGTLKIVWRPHESSYSLEELMAPLTAAVNGVLAVQHMAYGRETIDELNGETPCKMMDRRIEVLYELGGWPSDDNTFEKVSPAQQTQVLAKYRAMKLDVFDTKDLDHI